MFRAAIGIIAFIAIIATMQPLRVMRDIVIPAQAGIHILGGR